jgi:hypothetical protein
MNTINDEQVHVVILNENEELFRLKKVQIVIFFKTCGQFGTFHYYLTIDRTT